MIPLNPAPVKVRRRRLLLLQGRQYGPKGTSIIHLFPSFNTRPLRLFSLQSSIFFFLFFGNNVISHIAYQTKLYATQKDVNTTFSTNERENLNFLAILLYMGLFQCPSLDDYWATLNRVPQVATVMSSKVFRLLKRMIHFNDNELATSSTDRFFKV